MPGRRRCMECGERYARTLDRCPKCRAPWREPPRPPVIWILLVVLFAVLMFGVADRAGFL